MGREIRRVPLNFDWPLNKVWQGYLNPHFKECPEALKNNCHTGSSNAGKWLEAITRLIALIGEEAFENKPEYHAHFAKTGRIYPHPYLEEWGMAPRTSTPREVIEKIREIPDTKGRMREHYKYNREHPPKLLELDAEILQLVQGLIGGKGFVGGMAGSSNSYEVHRKLLEVAGLDGERWGICKVCNGDGLDPAVKEVYEAWSRESPPEGPGYQLWETTSEGSPISKVYATEDAFKAYLIGEGYSEEAATNFCKTGWAMSGLIVIDEEGVPKAYKDIESCAVSGATK